MRAFLENSKTGRRYEIIRVDGEGANARVVLKGEHAEFSEDFDKDKFKRLGYKLIRE